MKITIQKIIYPGKSLGISENKTILTDEGIPGETVDVTPLKEKKNYIEAKTINIINPSELRTLPACSHYQACGPYQYIEYSGQVNIKKAQLKELFPKTHINVSSSPIIWRYRNKIKLNVLWKNGKASLAYHTPESRDEFTLIDSCHMASENVNSFLGSFINAANKENLNFIREIEVRESFSTKELMFTAIPFEKSDNRLNELFSKFCLKDTYIEENVSGKTFRIGRGTFFQINIPMLEIAIQKIISSLRADKKDTLADLYCGIGTFGITLSPFVKEVIGIESESDNISFLKSNIKLNRVENFKLYEGSCEKLFPLLLNKAIDILIIDPPRKGIDNMLCHNINFSSIKKIAYLSCNPATLSRDLKILNRSYLIRSLHLLDFFPQTPHIETLAILERQVSS